MVSKSKLIKEGINYTDSLFSEIIKRVSTGVLSSDTLEEFLVNTQEYTSANPLVSTGYDKTMLNLILSETNNHRFSRPSQKELTRITISEQVGNLITNVGEEVKESIRRIATEEYNRGSNPLKMAKRFNEELTGINKKRARVIARTEIARTSTVSDYIISKEQGATHYTVSCRSSRCPVCKTLFCESSETGGDVEYNINDTEHLPPVHPNCRCVADFYKKKGYAQTNNNVSVEDTVYGFNENVSNSIDKFYNKRKTNKIEYGQIINLKTGEFLFEKDIKGTKLSVKLPVNKKYGTDIMSIHNHPDRGCNMFSGTDIGSFLNYSSEQKACAVVNSNEIFIATLKDNDKVKYLKESKGLGRQGDQISSYMNRLCRESMNEISKEYNSLFRNAKSKQEINTLRAEANQKANDKYTEKVLNACNTYAMDNPLYEVIEIKRFEK